MARGIQYLLVGLLLLSVAPASAETDEELAKRYYKLGETLYNRSEFEGALRQFKRSYEYSKRSALLFNIARCHESLGQHEEAIRAYEEYLQSKPANAENIRSRIRNLRRLLEKKVKPKETAPPPGPSETQPDEPGQPTGAALTPAQPGSATEPAGAGALQPTGEGDDSGHSRPLRLTGWILAGTGVALVATGVAMGVMASSKQDEVEQANADGKEYADVSDTVSTGETMNAVAIAGLVAGGVVAATGAVLLVLDWRAERKRARAAWIAPVMTAHGGGISAGLRF